MAEVASMTGFADATQVTEFGSITVEMKSVNGRFLELSLRLPEELRFAEGPLRERLGAAIARGKVDCRVATTRDPAAAASRINPAALAQLAELTRQIHNALPRAAPMGIGDILRWPGVIESAETDPQAWRAPLLAAVERALTGLQQSRAREGAALRTAMLERCAAIDAIVARLREQLPRILAEAERRLQERITQSLGAALSAGAPSGNTSSGNAPPANTYTREEINERIRQELTLQGMRADVAEEMDRLATHVAEVRRTLQAGGAIGRRLDFLMQELNREANTIGSKAAAVDTTNAAVDLKLLIEQMREQVQNIE
jgi:uncharacterized protein YicC (UPF0701 family)